MGARGALELGEREDRGERGDAARTLCTTSRQCSACRLTGAAGVSDSSADAAADGSVFTTRARHAPSRSTSPAVNLNTPTRAHSISWRSGTPGHYFFSVFFLTFVIVKFCKSVTSSTSLFEYHIFFGKNGIGLRTVSLSVISIFDDTDFQITIAMDVHGNRDRTV